jgi:metal-sulfur cluster biosynthetic enzyme
MTTEMFSLPIAPASECCSETEPKSEGLPALPVPSGSDCCHSHPVAATSVDAGTAGPCHSAANETIAAPVALAEPDDASLIDALRTVIDPELMINIVDLGLVYSINHSDRKALIEMTLTSPACPAGPQIISQAKMALEKIQGIDAAEIKLTMSPPWTPDRMTDDARDQLGIF